MKLISIYFISSNDVGSGVAFLISFSNFSLLVHSNMIDFYIFYILYPLTLANFFICSRMFCSLLGLFRNCFVPSF
jgi:hypothetical protein